MCDHQDNRNLAIVTDWNPEDARRGLHAFLHSPERKLKLLIVEDDDADRDLLAHEILEMEEFQCLIAEAITSPSAIEMLQESDYDLVFVDLKLPPRDGLEVIRQVREFKPRTRFVVTSGHPNLIQIAQGLKGLFLFPKPITRADLQLLFGTMEGGPGG